MKDNSQDTLWTAKQVARFCKLHLNTVYRFIGEDKIPGVVRLNGAVRFRKSAILKWVKENTQ